MCPIVPEFVTQLKVPVGVGSTYTLLYPKELEVGATIMRDASRY